MSCCTSCSAEGCCTRRCAQLSALWKADREGWIVCLCVAFVGVFGTGVMFSFGVFIVQLAAEYHRPLMEENFVASVPIFAGVALSPLCVWIIRRLGRHGYRWGSILGMATKSLSCLLSSYVPSFGWLFLTYSAVFGFGNCMVYMVSALVLADHFERDHRFYIFATSSIRYSVPIGSLLFNPITAWMIEAVGWQMTLRIYCAPLLVLGILLSWKLVPKHNNIKPPPDGAVDGSHSSDAGDMSSAELSSGLKDCVQNSCSGVRDRPEIVFWYLGNWFVLFGYSVPIFNLPYYMELRGFPPTQSAWILTLMGLAETSSYAVCAVLGHHIQGRLVYVNIGSSILAVLVYALIPSLDGSYGSVTILMILIAIANGTGVVYQYPAAIEVTELDGDTAWSHTNFWASGGMLLGPPLLAAVYDGTKSFDNVFYTASGFYALQMLCFAVIPLLKSRRSRKIHEPRPSLADVSSPSDTFGLLSDADSTTEYGTNNELTNE